MNALLLVSQRLHGDTLPAGWFRAFLSQVHGLAKGIYTTGPGPAKRVYPPLSFLGLTFVVCLKTEGSIGQEDATTESIVWDWSWNFLAVKDFGNPNAAENSTNKDRVYHGKLKGEGVTDDVQKGMRDVVKDVKAVLDNDASEADPGFRTHQPTSPLPSTQPNLPLSPDRLSLTKKRKAFTPGSPSSPSRQHAPAELQLITPPPTAEREGRAHRRPKFVPPEAPSPPQEVSPSPPISPTRRHSLYHDNEQQTPSKPSRRVRSPTPPVSSMGMGRRPRARMTDHNDMLFRDRSPESSFGGFVPLNSAADMASPRAPPQRRNTVDHSTHSSRHEYRRAVSPPAYSSMGRTSRTNMSNLDPFTPNPKLSRTTTEPLQRAYRAVSPSNDWMARALSPPPLPLETTYTSNTAPVNFTSATSYFQTAPLSPSLTYPPIPPLPPPPQSDSIPWGSPLSPASTSPVDSRQIGATFTVESISSVSDTTRGRFYKVRWSDTWETKRSLRESMDANPKYRVDQTLEWRYDERGQKVFKVRWKDSWEAEDDVGQEEAVRRFWEGRSVPDNYHH